MEFAIRDYYRAFEQRSRWAREDLLVDGELENYERELVEAWEPRHAALKDELSPTCRPVEKVAAGQTLYKWVENDAHFPLKERPRSLPHARQLPHSREPLRHWLAPRISPGGRRPVRQRGGLTHAALAELRHRRGVPFNPAYCGTLLAKTTEDFTKKSGRQFPFALAFLVLPVVLHRGTRSALPSSTVTSLLPWTQENRQ